MERESIATAGKTRSSAGWVVVTGVTFLAYLPAIFHSFVEWDDVTFIAGNPRFNPVSVATISYYWTHAGENIYMPVSYTLWAGLARMGAVGTPDATGSRLNPYLFHLASVLLHTAAALAIYLLIRKVVRSPWPSVIGALLFALHPLQVESVAFIGTMNTPLAACFGFWAVWLYLQSGSDSRAAEAPSRRWRTPSFLAATVLLLLALLSKPTAVVMPLIAFLLDLVKDRRDIGWRSATVSIFPWVVLAACSTVLAHQVQPASSVPPSSLWHHLVVAADAGSFYLQKLVIPWPLTIDYGHRPHPPLAALTIALFIAFLAIDATIARTKPGYRHQLILTAILAAVGFLPNSGLVSFDFQQFSTVADRYSYIAMLGPSLLLALAIRRLAQFRPRSIGVALTLLILSFLTCVTEKQIQTWADGTTLFEHAIAINPNSWMSYANLAYIKADSDPRQALADCQKSLALDPDNAIAWNTLGTLLIARGQRLPAITAFERAHQLAPDVPLFARNAATARRSAGN
jgi:hypothetical protein